MVAFGGETDVEARHVEPTVIVDPAPDSRIMQEEIFGPILPVITVESMNEAVEFVNDREKPLALYVFAEDDEKADELIAATTSGRRLRQPRGAPHHPARAAVRWRRRVRHRALPRPVRASTRSPT